MTLALSRPLRLGTRRSQLALWQAHHVRDRLRARWGDALQIELVEIVTEGDRILDRALSQVGGKGLFVNAIEDELLAGRIDFAVHSMKDLPAFLPGPLTITCTPEREDPRDALCGPVGCTLAALPAGARLGTASLRRTAFARRMNRGLAVELLRGNVPTRLAKVTSGALDAVLLAAAGLRRLGLHEHVTEYLDPEAFCPAACQGILALECRADDAEVRAVLDPLNHALTAIAAQAERAFLSRLEGGCQVPMACHARIDGEGDDAALHVHGVVVDPSGEPFLTARLRGPLSDAATLGTTVAERLLAAGAATILADVASSGR
jgi:hydroxymethylbilane synthase